MAGRGEREPTGFGERLKWVRGERGLSQQALADAVGCHQVTIAKLEAGKHEPDWRLVVALAEALSCTPNDFLADKEG